MVNLNDRLEDVGDPSSESNDHEKAAFRKPIVSSEGDAVPAVSLGDSVKESSGRLLICNHVSLLFSHAFDSAETE